MTLRRRFATGLAGVCLGNGLLTLSYVFDQTLLGPFTVPALAGTALGAVGSAITLYTVHTNRDKFDFADSGIQWYFPQITFVSGIVVVIAGLLTLALVVLN